MIKIIEDNVGNDILMFDNKVIPLNRKNASQKFIQVVINNCVDNSDYDAYQIKDGLYVIKEIKSYRHYKETTYKIIMDNIIELYTSIETELRSSFLAYNSKYITIVERDYDYPINEVVSAYDIAKKKIIDCNNYSTRCELSDGVVNYRRCLYDVIASVLTSQILMPDKERLFSFLSFVTNERINESNYMSCLDKVKKYIIHCYPGFKGKKIDTNQRVILDLNSIYGVDYFKFKKIPYSIKNLTYVKDKQLVK